MPRPVGDLTEGLLKKKNKMKKIPSSRVAPA
jgi:hypothetical protein